MAVTAAVWGVTSHSPASGGMDQPTQARIGGEQEVPCQVTYALRKDSGKDFTAELSLTNTGDRELRDWTMSFAFPGEQQVTTATPARSGSRAGRWRCKRSRNGPPWHRVPPRS